MCYVNDGEKKIELFIKLKHNNYIMLLMQCKCVEYSKFIA